MPVNMHSNAKSTASNGGPRVSSNGNRSAAAQQQPHTQSKTSAPKEHTGRPSRTQPDAGRGKNAARGGGGGGKKDQPRTRKPQNDLDCDYDELEDAYTVVEDVRVSAASITDSSLDLYSWSGGDRRQIQLSDVPVKVQKQKGDDFVVISDASKVIALEDSTNLLDGPSLDGWEYIRREEQLQDLAVSYAQAVGASGDK